MVMLINGASLFCKDTLNFSRCPKVHSFGDFIFYKPRCYKLGEW